MKRFLSVVTAALIGTAFVGGGPAGCTSTTETPAGDASYKCAMRSCTKTKTAKAGDLAPS